MKEYENLSGVFHCYAGGNKRIKKVLELGENWYFGIDGNLTYEDGLVDVIKNIPKDRLILETKIKKEEDYQEEEHVLDKYNTTKDIKFSVINSVTIDN